MRKRSVAEILAKLPKVATTSNTPKKENSNEPFNNPFKDHLYKKNQRASPTKGTKKHPI